VVHPLTLGTTADLFLKCKDLRNAVHKSWNLITGWALPGITGIEQKIAMLLVKTTGCLCEDQTEYKLQKYNFRRINQKSFTGWKTTLNTIKSTTLINHFKLLYRLQ